MGFPSLTRAKAELELRKRKAKRERELAELAAPCEASLAEFTRQAWPIIEPATELRWNWHLDVLCAYLEAFFSGRVTRLILNVPPGSMKSILVSVMGPAWKWAIDPSARLINLTNEIGLATRDSRRMRQVIESEWYQARWGSKVKISADQREKMHFENTAGGFRQGLGLGGSITGKRGDFLLIDDPVDAKKAFSDVIIQSANLTYDQAVSSRLNDPQANGICLIMQRLRTNDLTGHLLGKKATKWTHVRIPMEWDGEAGYDPVRDLGAEFDHLRDPRTKEGELMFPERFTPAVVKSLKEDLGDYGAAGQLAQRPSPLSGGIIRPSLWRVWPDDKRLPKIIHVFASWDTAFTEGDLRDAAYSARTLWGVWCDESERTEQYPDGRHKLLLLSSWWGRVGWDDLLARVRQDEEERLTHDRDAHLIERKASGISLIQTMRRRAKCRVLGYDPKEDGGGDKVARTYLVQPAFQSGLVWRANRPTAERVAAMVGEFPAGDALCKDITDTVTQAVNYLLKGWWIVHPDDDLDFRQQPLPMDYVPEDDDLIAPERSFYG